MSNKILIRAAVTAAVLSVGIGACAQRAGNGGATGGERKVDSSTERKEQILTNLYEKHPQLERLQPQLGEFEQVSSGFDQVTMTIMTPRGPQEQILLVTPDNKKLYIAMDGPIDVSKSATDLKASAQKQEQERTTELAAAVKDEPTRGNPQAKVTIIEFSDFQCPYCKRGYDVMEEVIKKHGDKVKLVFMHFPLDFHPWAKPAAIAAECAANQKPEAFWTLHDAYFNHQQELTPENVIDKSAEYLGGAGVDMAKWKDCTTNESSEAYTAAKQEVEQDMELGGKHGVQGTPAFFVNGKFVSGAQPAEEFDRLIQEALGS